MIATSDYESMFASAIVSTARGVQTQLDLVCKIISNNQLFYKQVQNVSKIPWLLVTVIHFRESNQNFTLHLHNGDPLTARTVHVPIGRPVAGTPPFTWAQSASDALSQVWKPNAWTIGSGLEFLERYNGIGYQKHAVNTPYLWDMTDKYTTGLYKSDGTFDANASESRPGCVAILKALALKGVPLDFSGIL